VAEAANLCHVGLLAGITPFVRVPHQCGNGFVQRVLDGGAMGVIFPHVESAGMNLPSTLLLVILRLV
jgi:2-keto-3-deoxy-L-rhamnonate aldolase RhmA